MLWPVPRPPCAWKKLHRFATHHFQGWAVNRRGCIFIILKHPAKTDLVGISFSGGLIASEPPVIYFKQHGNWRDSSPAAGFLTGFWSIGLDVELIDNEYFLGLVRLLLLELIPFFGMPKNGKVFCWTYLWWKQTLRRNIREKLPKIMGLPNWTIFLRLGKLSKGRISNRRKVEIFRDFQDVEKRSKSHLYKTHPKQTWSLFVKFWTPKQTKNGVFFHVTWRWHVVF